MPIVITYLDTQNDLHHHDYQLTILELLPLDQNQRNMRRYLD